MPVAGADQGQPAPLRHGAAQPLAGERAAQIGGERRALADGVDAGLLARMGDHRRDIAGGEDARIAGRAQGLVDRDKAVRRQRQPGLGEPGRGAGLGHPQGLVEADPPAVGADQQRRARRGQPRCRSAHAIPRSAKIRSNRWRTRRLCDGSSVSRVTRVTSSGATPSPASRYCADSASSTPPAPPPTIARRSPGTSRARASNASQRRGKTGDRLDRDRVLGCAGDIVRARRRADVERQQIVADRRVAHGTAAGARRGRDRSPRRGSAVRRQSGPAGRDRCGTRQTDNARRPSPAACRNRAFRHRGRPASPARPAPAACQSSSAHGHGRGRRRPGRDPGQSQPAAASPSLCPSEGGRRAERCREPVTRRRRTAALGGGASDAIIIGT